MAHVQKFTAGSVNGLSIHFDRKTVNHSNKDIDIERSHLNYDLRNNGDGLDTRSRMEERLKEVYCMKRADVKPMAVWVLTLPEELKDKNAEEQKAFFKAGYDFMKERYGGEKNVLSANVHNDETTPHMHFAFMPVVWDKKNQREKVSAKQVLTRVDLKSFHQDLDKHLKETIPEIYQGGVLNEMTYPVKDVAELKRHSKDFEQEIKRQKEEMIADLKVFKEPKKVLEKIETSAKKAMFGDKVSLPSDEYDKLKNLAISSVKTKYQLDKVKDLSDAKIEDLETRVQLADQRADNAVMQFGLLEKEVDKLREQQKNAIIYQSMLQDTNRDLEISDTEREGRWILFKLEKGHEPRNQEEGEQWLSILEKNKRDKTIPESRLEGFIGFLKGILDKMLGKDRKFSQEGLKGLSEQSKAPKKKSKSRGHTR
ncbi:MobV family relaxase [Bacillus thuringiensis]|uniref:MobV family relaxase n=1 Tax=Bacillus thuringiensis TaxID=1428 RepID=UPI0038143941